MQQKRRTGAGVFRRSGTVSNDAFAFGNVFEIAFFNVSQLNIERTFDVRDLPGVGAAYVNDDAFAADDLFFGLFDAHARH